MARIRTVKPEFWEHPKVTRVTRDARLLFLGLLNEADDEGKLRYSAKKLAGVLFGADDDVGAPDVDRWTEELEREGLVLTYEVDGAPLLIVLGFTEHQRVSHPSPSRLPNPRESSGNIREDDGNPRETLRPEGNREQGKGNPSVELTLDPDPVQAIFQAWQGFTGHHKAVLDKKRRRVIENARKHYPDDELIDACRGVMLSPHNTGQNERGMRYDDIGLVLRDAEHVERFRDLARAVPVVPPSIDFDVPSPNGKRCVLCAETGGWLERIVDVPGGRPESVREACSHGLEA